MQLQAEALRGLYTLWYAAGTSLGLLPPLPTQQKDILPAFAIDLPIQESMSIKDGRLGYTNKTLTWQVELMHIPDHLRLGVTSCLVLLVHPSMANPLTVRHCYAEYRAEHPAYHARPGDHTQHGR